MSIVDRMLAIRRTAVQEGRYPHLLRMPSSEYAEFMAWVDGIQHDLIVDQQDDSLRRYCFGMEIREDVTLNELVVE